MKLYDFLKQMETQQKITPESEAFDMFHKLSQDALKITMEINNKYHSPQKIVKLFSKLTGRKVDKSFRLFPPFYTDCGKNLVLGKNVFINACCKFQDQGGIKIGDNVFIGHNVVIATLNHDINPKNRAAMFPLRVTIGSNVWIGSNAAILPGVSIGNGAVIGAGSVITKDVPPNCIVAGNPGKIIRYIKSDEDSEPCKLQ